MILRIIFLGMLSLPFLYLFFILTGYLADDIVTKSEKVPENSYNYQRVSYRKEYVEEPEESRYRKDRSNKKRKFRVIR